MSKTRKKIDLLFIFLVILLATLGIKNYLPELAKQIETKLYEKIQTALHNQELDWVTVSINGRDVTVQGNAQTKEEYQQVLKVIAGINGIRSLNNQIQIQIKRINPYTLNAEYAANSTLVLDTYVPDEQARIFLENKLTELFTNHPIEKNIQLASGEPKLWQSSIMLVLQQLPYLETAQLEINNYDVRLSGSVATQQDIKYIKTNLDSLKEKHYNPYIYLRAIEATPALKNPYLLTAEYDTKTLNIQAYLPTNAVLTETQHYTENLLTHATKHINFELASGQPAYWSAAVHLLLYQLPSFQTARLEVTNYNVRLAGITATTAEKQTVENHLQVLKNYHYQLNLYLQAADVKPPPKRVSPYTFTATYNNQKLSTQGYLANQAMRRAIINEARHLFTHENFIDDGLLIASGQPSDWQTVIHLLLKQLPQFSSARLEIIDYDVRLTGLVPTVDIADSLKALQAELLAYNYHLKLYIQAADAQSRICQRKFNHLLNKEMIVFSPNKATIAAKSFYLLENLIAAAKICPNVKIQVEGHTDAIGNNTTNLALSQKRAEAVRDYLVQNGLSPEKVSAVGYGEERPITHNDTPEARAKNRRIEFVVIQEE